MRIIAGTKRGMKLASPKTDISRPILDRVKESLFSVLYKYDIPAGRKIADVFSGVGSMGLEALSRGADFVTFVEKDYEIIKILKSNIERAGFTGKSRIVRTNALKAGAPIDFERGKYDVVFIDPPYVMTTDVGKESKLEKMLALVEQQVVPNGIVTVRTHKTVELLEKYGELEMIDRRKWGNMAIATLQRTENDQ